MLSAFSKEPKEAVTHKWPEFAKPLQAEAAMPDIPGAEGFTRFDGNTVVPKEAPKPVVRPAIFENLKPITPDS